MAAQLAGLGSSAIEPTMPASVGCDFLAVAAKLHAAPATMVGLGAIREPEHAGVVFAALDQREIRCRQQIRSSFRQRRENRFGGVLSPDSFDLRRARFVPNKPEMTLGAGKKPIEERRISAPSSLSYFYKGANIFTQRSSAT
ncbi:MAG TPA: hypothetical protein VIH88_03670 [Candidatus Acidoferrales bacterium]